jgi:hypothetical protein
MRRGEKASGVIRPRTLGLGKVVTAPEPLLTPPPPPPPSGFLQNRKVRLTLVAGFLFFAALFFLRKEDNESAVAAASIKATDPGSLRSSPQNAVMDGKVEDAHEDNPSGEGHQDIYDEEKGDDDDDSKIKASDDNDPSDEVEEDNDDKTRDNVEPAAITANREQPQAKHNDDSRDRSKTIESYFVNFGGRVVEIDREGSYKYVLVRIEDIFGSQALLVRGCPHKEGTHCKHADAFARAKAELELRGFKATSLGGGRITRHPSRRQKGQKEGYISIFGYSKTFGACEECNKIACALIKASFIDHGVKWANEGYLESDERKVRDEAWNRC